MGKEIISIPAEICADELYQKEILSANILKCTVGTSGPRGGDAGHGGWIEFALEDMAATCWDVLVDNKPIDSPRRIRIKLRGDCEIDTFIRSLKFALKIYKRQIKEEKEKEKEKDIPW